MSLWQLVEVDVSGLKSMLSAPASSCSNSAARRIVLQVLCHADLA